MPSDNHAVPPPRRRPRATVAARPPRRLRRPQLTPPMPCIPQARRPPSSTPGRAPRPGEAGRASRARGCAGARGVWGDLRGPVARHLLRRRRVRSRVRLLGGRSRAARCRLCGPWRGGDSSSRPVGRASVTPAGGARGSAPVRRDRGSEARCFGAGRPAGVGDRERGSRPARRAGGPGEAGRLRCPGRRYGPGRWRAVRRRERRARGHPWRGPRPLVPRARDRTCRAGGACRVRGSTGGTGGDGPPRRNPPSTTARSPWGWTTSRGPSTCCSS